LRRLAAAVLTGAVLVGGCAKSSEPNDPLQVAATLESATPAPSPDQAGTPAGTVLPLTGKATALAFAGGVLAVAVEQPPSVLLYAYPDPTPRTVALPGPAARLTTSASGSFEASVPSGGGVVTISPSDGTTSSKSFDGGPSDIAVLDGKTFVAQHDSRSVRVGDHTIGPVTSPDQLLVAGDRVVVLDRLRSAVFDVDPKSDTLGAGLRAGDGATNAVVDRFGRVLVTDTRGGELLAFTANPLIMRQRYPVPGAPYGLAYDPRTDLAWVTLTEKNEVVAYHVAGGEPVEKYRFATVRQPDSVAVDPGSGRVYVASANGQGIQVISP
jgi:DNA-binding beta-propeller fold protein YncE